MTWYNWLGAALVAALVVLAWADYRSGSLAYWDALEEHPECNGWASRRCLLKAIARRDQK